MASPCSLLFLSTLIMHILAKPLQALSSSTLSQILPMVNSTNLPTLNASTPENPALNIQCSGEHFGHNPNIADCHSALEHISPDSIQHTWGLRHSGLGPTVFPLPYRIMGGQWSFKIDFYTSFCSFYDRWNTKIAYVWETCRSRFVFLPSCACSR